MSNPKLSKSKLKALDQDWRDRNVRLKSIGLPKETFEQFLEWVHGKGKKASTKTIFIPESTIPSARLSQMSANTIRSDARIEQGYSPTQLGIVEYKTKTSKALYPSVSNDGCIKPTVHYTGTKVIGIGTMHKSNMVPIFSDEEATDIARMRR